MPQPCFHPSLLFNSFFFSPPTPKFHPPIHSISSSSSAPRPSADIARDEQQPWPWPSERCDPASAQRERERDPNATTITTTLTIAPSSLKATQLVRLLFLFYSAAAKLNCSLFQNKTRSRSFGPLLSLNWNTLNNPILHRRSSSSTARSRVTLVCSEVRTRSFCPLCPPVFSYSTNPSTRTF